jgi:hypothetical protein
VVYCTTADAFNVEPKHKGLSRWFPLLPVIASTLIGLALSRRLRFATVRAVSDRRTCTSVRNIPKLCSMFVLYAMYASSFGPQGIAIIIPISPSIGPFSNE